MFQSEAEKIIKRFMAESKAEFTEEQIACLAKAILKITSVVLEEANSIMRSQPSGNNPPKFFSS